MNDLQKKLDELERAEHRMHAANAAYKLAKRYEINSLPKNKIPIETIESIADAVDLEVGAYLLTAIMWHPTYLFEKGPYTGWPLSHLAAQIQRLKKQIKETA